MCETTDTKPNIFKYATKELSQDAVICWLIKWAFYDGSGYEDLRKCGQNFIAALFKKHDKEVPQDVEEIEIWQQDNNIDVLARIGEYALLIEDKIDGKLDRGQLTRYYDLVVNGETEAEVECQENILPIFLKTGNHSLYEQVIEVEHLTPPYKVFDREDFLQVVEPYSTAHPILEDFTARLKCWERAMKSFEDWTQDEQWEWRSIEGFFRELENHLVAFDRDNSKVGFGNGDGNDRVQDPPRGPWGWGWENPPGDSPDFCGFNWYYKTVESCGHDVELYLQLEIRPDNPHYSKLCFKVNTQGLARGRSQIREDCHNRILAAGEVGALDNLVCRPVPMGEGNTMTVALWNNENRQNPWLVFQPNGGPDIQATVENLVTAQSVLDSVA